MPPILRLKVSSNVRRRFVRDRFLFTNVFDHVMLKKILIFFSYPDRLLHGILGGEFRGDTLQFSNKLTVNQQPINLTFFKFYLLDHVLLVFFWTYPVKYSFFFLPSSPIQRWFLLSSLGFFKLSSELMFNLNFVFLKERSSDLSSRFFISGYIAAFFSYFLSSKVCVLFRVNSHRRISSPELLFLEVTSDRLRFFSTMFSTIFFIDEVIRLFFITIKHNIPDLVLNWINRILNSLLVFQHRNFLKLVMSFFTLYMLPIFPYFQICGSLVCIRGKIGVTGNARKRQLASSTGRFDMFNVRVETVFENRFLRTRTGALGLIIIILRQF